MKDMNRIIIVGNGFDLAHGLKTKYEDFINWYWKQCGYNLLHCSEKEMSDGLCSFKIKDGVNVHSWASVFQGWYFKRENPLIPWNENDAFFVLFKIKIYVISHSQVHYFKEYGIGYC